MSWNTSLTFTPRSMSSARAASISVTASCRPSAEPGAAEVAPRPKMIEHAEPGRRQLHDPEPALPGEIGIQAPSERLIEVFGPIHVGHRYHDHFELQVHGRSSFPSGPIAVTPPYGVGPGITFASGPSSKSRPGHLSRSVAGGRFDDVSRQRCHPGGAAAAADQAVRCGASGAENPSAN